MIGIAALAVVIVALAYVMRRKHRETWTEIFRLRGTIESLQRQLVASRKEIVLMATSRSMRLPPLMPSQNGEDVVLWDLFERRREGFYVDVGGYDGVGFSNTYFFEAIGWSGIVIEAVPELYKRCAASRPHSTVVHAACGAASGSVAFTVADGPRGVATLSSMTPDHTRIAKEGGSVRTVEVPLRTLDDILAGITEPIDFVSIDVEGAELEVLRGFDLERFRPRLLVIEDNSAGADRSVANWLAERGYLATQQLEQNIFYTRRDELAEETR
ncbi:MAG TPA: FkbM family methyltransferase [Thermoanaerobaculia bacterium]|nr:FkbM family methyltransferase [Thermoanaerobaculia bacterium]